MDGISAARTALTCNQELEDFLSRCLVRDQEKRWTASKLLKHPWFSQCDPILKPSEAEAVRYAAHSDVIHGG